jgi:hypothetical protein
MERSNLASIRTRLRAINVEYSVLVRRKADEGRFVRLGELRSERWALMAQLVGGSYPSEVASMPGAVRPEAANENVTG